MDSVHHIWCPLSSQEYQDLPDGAETTLTQNSRIAGEKITVYDYPDGSIAFRHLHRPLGYKIFDKLACVDQGAVVDNKRLGAVLKLAQQKQDELEAEGKRMRSKKMPRRRAQERVLEELRAINPVLASPQDFVPSLKR
ncbi:hypothetical protein KTO09_26425 [Klebsiella pneumoniae]|nr:hypothetical protein [Klebsiella pneumoniae]HEO0569129.1 hypothetical protein [Klebsiella pneumoniae]